MSGLYGISAYQQVNQTWTQSTKKKDAVTGKQSGSSSTQAASGSDTEIKKTTWSPIDTSSSLVPTNKDDIGMAIGDVQLSDTAKEYYNELKSKFGNMEFIVVSQDMKSQVQANAAAYGNSSKQVVLIDDAKLEQMATDESYRKKYEGIIAMSQSQLADAKSSLTSTGAVVKNMGMSVNSDGTTSFFAVLEKSADEQSERLQKKLAEKKAAKAKEKKQAEKKEKEEKLEETREARRKEQKELTDRSDDEDVEISSDDNKEYIEFEASTVDALVRAVSKYAYENSSRSVMTEEEKSVGQNFDLMS